MNNTIMGMLNLSADRRFLVLGGLNTSNGRVIARIDKNENIHTGTVLTNASDIRSVTSTDGTKFWFVGSALSVQFTRLDSSTAIQVCSNQGTNRHIGVVNNRLYASNGGGLPSRIGTPVSGLPETPGDTLTPLPGLPSSGSTYQFVFFDLNPSVPGPDVLYLVYDNPGNGIRKYSLVNNTWVANGISNTNPNTVGGYRGITGQVDITNPNHVALYATTTGNLSLGGSLVVMDDYSGYNGQFYATPYILATSPANSIFRGIALSPESSDFYFPTPYQLPYSTPQNAINQQGNQFIIADPIQLGTGTYSYSHNDFAIPAVKGTLSFTRFYNSLNGSIYGPLGYGWSHTYNYYLENRQDTAWDVRYPDGHISTFIPMNTAGQSFPLFRGTLDMVQKNMNNSYSLFTKEKTHYHFNSAGKLDSIIDLNGNSTRLYYTGNVLDSIVAPGGRSLALSYSANRVISVKDRLNRVWAYSYDADSNLISAKDPRNNTTSFTFDSGHRMLTAVNPLGNIIITNIYDSSGRVVSQKDADNQVTSIVYNSPGQGDATVTNPDNSHIVVHHDAFLRKTTEKDELDFIKTYTYDGNGNVNGFTNENNQSERKLFDNFGNLLSDTLPGGKITNITYNYFNSPVQVTDPRGNQKTFHYNSINNNLDSIRFPDNSLHVYYYNGLGQPVQFVDGNGNSTFYTYSPAGDLLTVQTAAGIKQFTYDAAGRKTSATDENGHTTGYTYDNNNNLLLITDALGRTTENTYDANNQLTATKDRKGFITGFTYDNKGRKTSITNPKGGVTSNTYNVRDNLVSVTDPVNNTVVFAYDAKGRKISAANGLGITQYEYDGAGNITKSTDPANSITYYTYTGTNKKQTQVDGLGNTIGYAYDLNDNLISVTNPLNQATVYNYDAMNRLLSVTDAANKITAITYDNNGNQKTIVDPMGHTQAYSYDAANRLTGYLDAAGNTYSYSYDSAGNNISFTKPTGVIAKAFDAANRIITVTNSTGNNYSFGYDNNDNISTMSTNAGATNMVYDSLDQLKQYQDPYNKTVSFTYDAAGKRTSLIYPGNKTILYSFDNAGNLKTVTDWLSHTFTYAYDSAGRVKQLVYPNGARCNYGYDKAGRLTSKINRSGTNSIFSGSTFTLDAVGNRVAEQRLAQAPSSLSSLSRSYAYTTDDRMLSDSVWNYVNDNSGNRIFETNGTDSASYSFSADNLLGNRTDTAGIFWAYVYDASGHRIAKNAGPNSNRFVLDISNNLSQVLQITDSNGVLKANYIYGLGLLESIDASDSVLFYHFDAQHNTVALTDLTGLLKESYTYEPFGSRLSQSGTTIQPFTFLGEFGVEQESPGLYYARARYYDASNGRFLSKDAFPHNLDNPQTINRYVYATNNPVSRFDYTGMYGDQDNYGFDHLSFIETLFHNLTRLTDGPGFISAKAILELAGSSGNSDLGAITTGMKGLGAMGSGIKVGFTMYKSYKGEITSTEAGLSNFVTMFPYLPAAIGTSLGGAPGGVIGGLAGKAIVYTGTQIGNAITNTSWGLNASNWLLSHIQ